MFKLKKYDKVNLSYACFALIVLSTLNLLNYADRSVFNSLMDPIKAQFALSDLQLGWLASAFLLVYAVAAYPLARVADKGARKTVLVAGVMIWSAATFFTGLSHSFPHLFLSRSILGMGEASYATTLAPLISDYFPAGLRSTALGVANAPLGIGTALGYYVGGFSMRGFGWRHAFFILGIPGILFGFAAMFLREPEMGLSDRTRGANEKPPPTGSSGKVLPILLQIKTLRYLWGSSILLTFSLGAMLVWMAPLLHRHYGFSVASAAIRGASAAAIGSLLGILVGGVLADWWGRRAVNGHIWVVVLGFALSGLFAFLVFHVVSQKAVLFCIGMIAFFQMATNGPFLAAMMNVTLPNMRSTCNAIYLFLIHLLGDATSPLIVGFLSKQTGDLKRALMFMPWVTLLSAVIACGALFHYAKDKERMLSQLK